MARQAKADKPVDAKASKSADKTSKPKKKISKRKAADRKLGKTMTMAAAVKEAKPILGDKRKLKKKRDSAKKAASALKKPKVKKSKAKKAASAKKTSTKKAVAQ